MVLQGEETANKRQEGSTERWGGTGRVWDGRGAVRWESGRQVLGAVLGSVVKKEGPLEDHAHGNIILGSLR